jgi:hypothetical protein
MIDLAAILGYGSEHNLCNAHILRDLNHLEKVFHTKLAKQIKELLLDTKKTKEKKPNLKASYYSNMFNKYVNIIRPILKKYDKK